MVAAVRLLAIVMATFDDDIEHFAYQLSQAADDSRASMKATLVTAAVAAAESFDLLCLH